MPKEPTPAGVPAANRSSRQASKGRPPPADSTRAHSSRHVRERKHVDLQAQLITPLRHASGIRGHSRRANNSGNLHAWSDDAPENRQDGPATAGPPHEAGHVSRHAAGPSWPVPRFCRPVRAKAHPPWYTKRGEEPDNCLTNPYDITAPQAPTHTQALAVRAGNLNHLNPTVMPSGMTPPHTIAGAARPRLCSSLLARQGQLS